MKAEIELTRLATLEDEIRTEVEAAEADFQSAVGHAIKAGEGLIEAKSLVKHGEWLPWLKANFPGSERTARTYMQLARNRQRVADLPTVREALELLAPAEVEVVRVKRVLPPRSKSAPVASSPDVLMIEAPPTSGKGMVQYTEGETRYEVRRLRQVVDTTAPGTEAAESAQKRLTFLERRAEKKGFDLTAPPPPAPKIGDDERDSSIQDACEALTHLRTAAVVVGIEAVRTDDEGGIHDMGDVLDEILDLAATLKEIWS